MFTARYDLVFKCNSISPYSLEAVENFITKNFAPKHMRTVPLGGVCVCRSNHLVEKSQ